MVELAWNECFWRHPCAPWDSPEAEEGETLEVPGRTISSAVPLSLPTLLWTWVAFPKSFLACPCGLLGCMPDSATFPGLCPR